MHAGAAPRALALSAALWAAGAAAGGPPAGAGVIAGACPGPGAASLLLLPEDREAVGQGPDGAVTVTGAYTATDRRDGDRPKPVGLFIHDGERVSLEFGRMDGILVIGPDGAVRIAAAPSVPLAGTRHDLTTLRGRLAFARAAEAAGASVMQSHLLIRDGALDLRPVEDAPLAERRLLFQTEDRALGLWESEGRALTLYEAAAELQRLHAPAMALNLDMGGHDFCLRIRDGEAVSCGRVALSELDRLSNLLRLKANADCP